MVFINSDKMTIEAANMERHFQTLAMLAIAAIMTWGALEFSTLSANWARMDERTKGIEGAISDLKKTLDDARSDWMSKGEIKIIHNDLRQNISDNTDEINEIKRRLNGQIQ